MEDLEYQSGSGRRIDDYFKQLASPYTHENRNAKLELLLLKFPISSLFRLTRSKNWDNATSITTKI